jgi:ribosomal protein L11 methyltransferase
VISIAAAKLGFQPVIAIDFEEAAVEVAAGNAQANGVELDVRLADATEDDLPETGLVIANISLAAVEAAGPRFVADRAITAGYLVRDEPALPGFRRLERRELDGWAADLFARD